MRKIVTLVVVFVVVGSTAGWCISETLDAVMDSPKNSDLLVMQDAGKALGAVNEAVNLSYDAVTEPLNPVLDPIRTARNELLNGVWDVLTLKSVRSED